MSPDLASYHWIVVNSSAGKDSQAMLDFVVEQWDRAEVPLASGGRSRRVKEYLGIDAPDAVLHAAR